MNVFMSESPDFPVAQNVHSYEACLANVRRSDLLIALVWKRYGGLYSTEADGRRISVTLQEIREAKKGGTPVWTFVRTKTWDERYRFKRLAAERNARTVAEKDLLFGELTATHQVEAEDHHVYSLVDEITAYPESNWIFQFESVEDLLEKSGIQLAYFLEQFFYKNTTFPDSSLLRPDLLRELTEWTYLSSSYKGLNINVLERLPRLREHPRLEAMVSFNNALDRVFDRFSIDYEVRLDTIDLRSRKPRRILVTDTTMDELDPQTWRNSKYHKRIIDASTRLAKRYNLGYSSYVRVLLLRDPRPLLGNTEWQRSLSYLMRFHNAAGIKIGVARRQVLPATFEDTFLNFVLVPGKELSLWAPKVAMAFEVQYSEQPKLMKLYAELYDSILEACDTGIEGFWIEPTTTLADVVLAMKRLFTPDLEVTGGMVPRILDSGSRDVTPKPHGAVLVG